MDYAWTCPTFNSLCPNWCTLALNSLCSTVDQMLTLTSLNTLTIPFLRQEQQPHAPPPALSQSHLQCAHPSEIPRRLLPLTSLPTSLNSKGRRSNVAHQHASSNSISLTAASKTNGTRTLLLLPHRLRSHIRSLDPPAPPRVLPARLRLWLNHLNAQSATTIRRHNPQHLQHNALSRRPRFLLSCALLALSLLSLRMPPPDEVNWAHPQQDQSDAYSISDFRTFALAQLGEPIRPPATQSSLASTLPMPIPPQTPAPAPQSCCTLQS